MTNFYGDSEKNVELKQKKTYNGFSLIDLNSIHKRIDNNNNLVRYPQVYLEECRYRIKKVKKIKKKRFLTKAFKSDSSDNEADNEAVTEPDSDLNGNNESEKPSKKS